MKTLIRSTLALCLSVHLTTGGCTPDQKTTPTKQAAQAPAFEPPLNPLKDLKKSELIHSAIKKQVKNQFLLGLKNKDTTLIGQSLHESFLGSWITPSEQDWNSEGSYKFWNVKQDKPRSFLSKANFLRAVQTSLQSWALIERTKFSVFENQISTTENEGLLKAHFQVSGMKPDRFRLEMHGILIARVARRSPTGDWKITALDFESLRWFESRSPVFRDIGPQTGFTFSPSAEAQQLVQDTIDERVLVTGGGITVLDVNKDNYWDLIATYANRETKLFLNDGHGGFVVQPTPAFDDANEVSKFFIWIDLDNDGQEELVGSHSFLSGEASGEFGLYRVSSKGKISRKKRALRFSHPKWMKRMSFESIVACDVNQDDKIDLIFTGYSHLNSKDHHNLMDANDGLRNLLFINQGNLKFTEESRKRGLVHTQYSFVSACHDFDKDGDPDIFIGNDYGKNNFYENRGNGYFVHDTKHPFHLGSSFSMGISIADYDNTGQYAVSVSNMYSHAGHRIIPLADELKDKKKDFMLLVKGNALYENQNGQWANTAKTKFVDDAGWAWGNIFFDIDNDGDKDLFVTNGYTTHSDPHLPDY